MPNIIKPKSNATTGVIPTPASLAIGEIASNTADGRLFIKKSDNTVVQIGASSGGTPAGADTQVQYNNAGAFGASPFFTFSTGELALNTSASTVINSSLRQTASASRACQLTQQVSTSTGSLFTNSTGTILQSQTAAALCYENTATTRLIGLQVSSAGLRVGNIGLGTDPLPILIPQGSSAGTVGAGTAGQVWTSGGAGANTYWANITVPRTISYNDSTTGISITQSGNATALTISSAVNIGYSLGIFNTANGGGAFISLSNTTSGFGVSVSHPATSGGGFSAALSNTANTGSGVFINHSGTGVCFAATGSGTGYAFSSLSRSGADSTNSKSIQVGRIQLIATTLLTTPTVGAIEYDGTNLYFTDGSGVRTQLN